MPSINFFMEYGVVIVPAAAMRKKPDHRKEMTSQLLFGESVKILKQKELWIKVRGLHDNYEGWITSNLIRQVEEPIASAMSCCVANELIGTINRGADLINIPIGSSLPFFEENAAAKKAGKGLLANEEYSFSGQVIKRDEMVLSPELIKRLTSKWLNAPYLWGGRTPLGVDCSGFVQVIFKMLGIDLPRDAWQQALEGRSVKKFSEICPGDLAFFVRKKSISHVGIILSHDQIIHASGKVRVDTFTKKGILWPDGSKGPRLKTLRRIWH